MISETFVKVISVQLLLSYFLFDVCKQCRNLVFSFSGRANCVYNFFDLFDFWKTCISAIPFLLKVAILDLKLTLNIFTDINDYFA